ncbi:MAG TPA: hypothetical protein VEC17_03280, partial [Candidatus Binatia bacterium]|nr:hypothetical protein [Candidatus Binatia bacterium]
VILVALGAYLKDSGQMSNETIDGAGMGLVVIYVIVFLYLFLWLGVSLLTLIKNRNTELTAEQVSEQTKPMIGQFFWTGFLSGLLTTFGFILLIIPGIIFWVWYSFAQNIYVDKGVKGYDALKLSKKYVEGLWWPVFRALIALMVISILVNIVTEIATVVGGEIASGVVSVIILIVFTPYSFIYTWLVYEKLKALKPEVQ